MVPVDDMAGYDFLNGIPEVGHRHIPLVEAVANIESGKMAAFALHSTGHAFRTRTNGYVRRSIDYCCMDYRRSSVVVAAAAGLADYPGMGHGRDHGTADDRDHCHSMEGPVVDCTQVKVTMLVVSRVIELSFVYSLVGSLSLRIGPVGRNFPVLNWFFDT